MLTFSRGSAESAVTIIAASIPVLRTLFRDLQTLSRRQYGTGRPGTNTGTKETSDVEMSRGRPVERTATSSSAGSSARRDSCGEILQRTEFMVTVEYCKGHRDDGHYDIQRV